jgi:Bacterial SH3 domain
MVFGAMIMLCFGLPWNPAAAMQVGTTTPSATVAGGAYITVTYIEPINVRTGPSSFDYPVIGSLPVGGTAPALGRSPAGEWIQISFPDAPRGTAWVYAANVTLSPVGTLLPIVEPPPTPAPLVTSTLNPTFVAAFQTMPTATRLPTFTVPPTLEIPTYTNPADASPGRSVTTGVILVIGLIGIIGIVFTSFRHRRD